MYILGYSGLHNYLKFKKESIKDLSYYESLVGQGMDSAAAIYYNGKLIAAAEERFSGQKHTGNFPIDAIQTCLSDAGISINDISLICHSFNYDPYAPLFYSNSYTYNLYKKILCDQSKIKYFANFFHMDIKDIKNRYQSFDHHLSHAAYAYYSSGYDESLIIVADGIGEFSSISVFSAKGAEISLVKEYGPKSSLGMLYSAITEYLGFISNMDEYKVMGLAAYGNKDQYLPLLEDIISWDHENMEIIHLLPNIVENPADRETYRYMKNWLTSKLPFVERTPQETIRTHHQDLAASLQHILNEAMLHLVTMWQKHTGQKNLCLSGGVALNCVTNAYIAERCIKETHILSNLYIPPAAGDDGTAIGAALLGAKALGISPYIVPKEMPFYGSAITNTDSVLNQYPTLHTTTLSEDMLVATIVKLLNNSAIVALAIDRMEFGPRALGNRSILASPCKYEMRERINHVTKQRESFRPFAPIVKEEELGRYFHYVEGVCYKHMIVNVQVKKEYRNRLQAVTHVDGTARVQTVSKKNQPFLWHILTEFEKYSGFPILLNTSFNLKNKPIVRTAKEAVDSLVSSDIDALVLNNTLVTK